MDMGFAIIGSLARHPRPPTVLVHRLASLLHASFRPRLAASVISPLRFAMTSPPSGCQRDFHPQAVEHARHTDKTPRSFERGVKFSCERLERNLSAELDNAPIEERVRLTKARVARAPGQRVIAVDLRMVKGVEG